MLWSSGTKAVFCLVFLQQCLDVAIAGELHTTSRDIEAEIEDQVQISCVATLSAADSLVLSMKSLPSFIVNALSLDQPTEINLYRGTVGVISVSYGEISTVPDRVANLTMSITAVTREAEGDYKCLYTSGSDSSGQATADQKLQLVGPPYNATLTSGSKGVKLEKEATFDRNAYPNSQAVWIASVDIDEMNPFEVNAHFQSRPDATVTWSKNDYEYESSKLDIDRNEDDLDGSVFVCSAENAYGSYGITMIVKAHYKPREPTVINREMYPEEGKQMVVECQFNAVPAATVFYVKVDEGTNEWQRGNRTEEREQDGKYIISDVELARDIGKYMCVGENYLGTTTGEFYVYGKPKDVNVVIGDRYGDSLDLLFKAFSSIPLDFEIFYNSTEDTTDRSVQVKIDERTDQSVPNIIMPYTINELEPLTSYTIQLKAWNRHGHAWSPSINVTTGSEDDKKPIKLDVVKVTKEVKVVDDDENGASCMTVSLSLAMVSVFFYQML